LAGNPVARRGVVFAARPISAIAANMEYDAMNDPDNRNPGQQREQPQREQQQRQNQTPGQKPGQKQDQKKSDQNVNRDQGDNRE
jgi:hypothetical protein